MDNKAPGKECGFNETLARNYTAFQIKHLSCFGGGGVMRNFNPKKMSRLVYSGIRLSDFSAPDFLICCPCFNNDDVISYSVRSVETGKGIGSSQNLPSEIQAVMLRAFQRAPQSVLILASPRLLEEKLQTRCLLLAQTQLRYSDRDREFHVSVRPAASLSNKDSDVCVVWTPGLLGHHWTQHPIWTRAPHLHKLSPSPGITAVCPAQSSPWCWESGSQVMREKTKTKTIPRGKKHQQALAEPR